MRLKLFLVVCMILALSMGGSTLWHLMEVPLSLIAIVLAHALGLDGIS